MERLLLLLLFLLLLSIQLFVVDGIPKENYEIVRCIDNNNIYLLHNGISKRVTDNDEKTIEFLGFNVNNLHNITKQKLLLYHNDNTTIPLIHQQDLTPDEIMRVEILKITSITSELVYDFQQIGKGLFGYVNPSTIIIKDRLLALWGEFGEVIRIGWVNHTDYPYYSTEPYYNITNEKDSIWCNSGTNSQCMFAGQDPRVIMFKDKVIIFYTNRFANPNFVRMGKAEFIINEKNKSIDILKNNPCIHPPPHVNHRLDQKNWSPFIYNDTILLILFINPLTVIEMRENESPEYLDSAVVSKSLFKEIPWSYGSIRGGTNAILLPNENIYLAFFHSKTNLQEGKNGRTTYFMGAYTFSTKPPFELISISPFPVLHSLLYAGKWDYLTKRSIDYCPFPMSLAIAKDNSLLLTLGHNDEYGYITKVRLESLLSSMIFIGENKNVAEIPL